MTSTKLAGTNCLCAWGAGLLGGPLVGVRAAAAPTYDFSLRVACGPDLLGGSFFCLSLVITRFLRNGWAWGKSEGEIGIVE